MVLLDEPGAGVNPTVMNELVSLIRTARHDLGITFLVIEHDVDLVMELCDTIVVMNNGVDISHGSPEHIQNDQRVVEAYLGTPG